ncbi:MAG: phage tail protein [Proteobacteria bacterium]|nr:phage tail protein [Pseudomonadota bacterium]
MPVAERKDPYLSFRFLVEIQGLIVGGFSEVSGLQAETEIEEIREGGVNDYVHKLPKITKYPNITLKRGITDSDVLWNWHQDVVNGIIKRKSGFIILLDGEGNEKWRWYFEDAYPVKWLGPDLKADSNTVAVETLELAHNGIKKG